MPGKQGEKYIGGSVMRKKLLLVIAVTMLSLLTACGSEPKGKSDLPTEPTAGIGKTDKDRFDKDKEDVSHNDTAKPDKEPANTDEPQDEPVKEPEKPEVPAEPEEPETPEEPEEPETPEEPEEPEETIIPKPMPVFTYETVEGGVIIKGIDNTSVTEIVIPDVLDGYPVIGISKDAFVNCTDIEHIVVDEKNTALTSKAADGTECNAVISIAENKLVLGCVNTVIPETVKVIAEYAFAGIEITKVVIPATVEKIEARAFEGCKLLEEVVIEGPTLFDNFSFVYCDAIKNVTLSSECMDVGIEKLFYANNLTSITILEGIQKLKSGMFSKCTALKELHIPASVVLIDPDTLKDLPLENITIADDNSFYTTKDADGNECYAIFDKVEKKLVAGTSNTVIPSEIKSIADYAFCGRNMQEFIIPDTIESIGSKPFSYVEKLTVSANTWFTSNVKGNFVSELILTGTYNGAIPDQAFEGFSILTDVKLPEGITAIGLNAFAGCHSLTNVTIPEGVTEIGGMAFNECRSLVSVTIPESVTVIGRSAFVGCNNLTSVIIPAGVTAINEYTFQSCSSLTSVTIPESVTVIGDYAFKDCSNLTDVKIPEGVTTIGSRAFYGCSSLTSIEIPKSVTVMGNHLFPFCTNLTEVRILGNITGIGDAVFYGCSNLSSIEIPESVTSIHRTAFEDCTNISIIYAKEGSYAANWGKDKGYRVIEPQ